MISALPVRRAARTAAWGRGCPAGGAVAVDWQVELNKVLTLQQLDLEIDALRAERRGLLVDPREVELQKALEARRVRAALLHEELAATERLQRMRELERQGQEAERERNTRRLYGGEVRNSRDLEGLQKNIEGNAGKISELETAILEAMERIDQLTDALGRARDVVAQLEERLQRHRQSSRKRLAAIDRHLPGLRPQRDELAGRIDPAVLREYERLRRRMDGVCVAPVSGSTCGGCGLELPALVQAKLRRTDEPVYCEHCGRLLLGE
jgi:predicted  nucleic acid-binding Zn-ribbon protein